MLSVLFEAIGGPDASALAEALEVALRPLGFPSCKPGVPGTACVMVVGDDDVVPSAQRIAELSASGFVHVLAVTLSPTPLSDGGAWRLLTAGATDVVMRSPLRNILFEVRSRLQRWDEVETLIERPEVAKALVGQGVRWRSFLRRLVDSAALGTASVLLLGETGTGKEVAARIIHALDRRPSKGELVVLDCTTLVPELAGSELFGHERGAFTGSVATRQGAVALADGGTLFLDEVGELPVTLQAQLLRVTQERTYKRVGGDTWRRSNFRLVCATNRDLEAEVSAGRFRSDLYHRIATVVMRLPPLRDRMEDVLPLARHFIRQFRPDILPPLLDTAVEEVLVARQYPGNVRDLRQLVERMTERHVGEGPLSVGDLDPEDRIAAPAGWRGLLAVAVRNALTAGVGLKEIARVASEAAVTEALREENGNVQRAAQRLKVTDRALQLRRATRTPASA